jgi:hypothetical protein
VSLYGVREMDGVRPGLQIAMPRLTRLYAPSGTMHVVAPFSAQKERLSPPSIKLVQGSRLRVC